MTRKIIMILIVITFGVIVYVYIKKINLDKNKALLDFDKKSDISLFYRSIESDVNPFFVKFKTLNDSDILNMLIKMDDINKSSSKNYQSLTKKYLDLLDEQRKIKLLGYVKIR